MELYYIIGLISGACIGAIATITVIAILLSGDLRCEDNLRGKE